MERTRQTEMDVTVKGVAVKGASMFSFLLKGRHEWRSLECFDRARERARARGRGRGRAVEMLRERGRGREREQQRTHLRETVYRVERDLKVSKEIKETQYPVYSLSKRRQLQ